MFTSKWFIVFFGVLVLLAVIGFIIDRRRKRKIRAVDPSLAWVIEKARAYQVVTDRLDARIEAEVDISDLQVAYSNGIASVFGFVRTEADKEKVTRILQADDGVREVTNSIIVENSSGAGQDGARTIGMLIDRALALWEKHKLNSHPGKVPPEMRTGETLGDSTYWKAMDSTVEDADIAELAERLGVELSPQYVELLRHKHFMECRIGEISLIPHPIGTWKDAITEAILRTYPRELLVDKGYLPFAEYSDSGLLCFGVRESSAGGEYCVYRWDHERPEDFERFAPDLRTALQQEAEQAIP